jgi:hypothetical protein
MINYELFLWAKTVLFVTFLTLKCYNSYYLCCKCCYYVQTERNIAFNCSSYESNQSFLTHYRPSQRSIVYICNNNFILYHAHSDATITWQHTIKWPLKKGRETSRGTIIFKRLNPPSKFQQSQENFYLYSSWQNSEDNQPYTCTYVHERLNRWHEIRTHHDIRLYLQYVLWPHAVALIATTLNQQRSSSHLATKAVIFSNFMDCS